MAGLFTQGDSQHCRLLDAGAGIGVLSAAFLECCIARDLAFRSVTIDVFEIDERLHSVLAKLPNGYGTRAHSIPVAVHVHGGDFIKTAVERLNGSLFARPGPAYSHSILNPPYRKIRSDSAHRLALRSVGIETVNLYSAFVALALSLTATKCGQLVAIIPRSFCNGPYYRPFRDYLLARAAIKHIHLFGARDQAFKDDDVLQENVIIMLQRGIQQGRVTITTSTDDSFSDLKSTEYSFDEIVLPGDSERFIHVPVARPDRASLGNGRIRYTLGQLDIQVSTGPVVDHRFKLHLRAAPGAQSVPLIYPSHMQGWSTNWPAVGKKPNAIAVNSVTRKWLYPNGYYALVRRFSSKEERRRIVASVVVPDAFRGYDAVGFENHLNVFHSRRSGLSERLAHGLAVFLNSSLVDESFRRFNGHTQVNATDLRGLKYPSRRVLARLGHWAMHQQDRSQGAIDSALERVLYGKQD